MGLTLVTGPANSAKAQVVLERYRAALARGPILVVPRAADVEYYRRELAGEGAVIGVRVEAFNGLISEIARRAGVTERPLGDHAKQALVGAVVGAARLDVLSRAAAAPGFTEALTRFITELESRRVDPARLTGALRSWAGAAGRRRVYVDELAALYSAYRRRLERIGLLDRELLSVAALDAIRLAPERWGRTPIFCYGFDDLEPVQVDAIETLAHAVGAAVTLSLPGEPGRVALAGRAGTLEALRGGADEVVTLAARAEYYEDAGALHHVERSLFEAVARRDPENSVALLEGGDEHAEAELVAAEVATLIEQGFLPGEIAVVTRASAALSGDLVAEALEVLGVPYALARHERFADSAVGHGLLALLRCARGDGDGAELVAWLRTPGNVVNVGIVDSFEAALVRGGVRTLADARAEWEREHWPLSVLGRIAESAPRGGELLIERVEQELDRLFAAPQRRAAALIDPLDAAAIAAARRALHDLRELTRADGGIKVGLAAVIEALECVTAERVGVADADAVLICDALSLRARRVRALFVCALQEGSFPAPGREEAFLGERERAEIARATGLVLSPPQDSLAAERYLFYALCSRPTARLVLSWHDATDDGDVALRSLFVEDFADCFAPELLDGRRRRAAGAISWDDGAPRAPLIERFAAALAQPRARARPIAAGEDREAVAALRSSPVHSASALELWAGCPVAWFVDRGLASRPFEPDPIAPARGTVAHEVLARIFARLHEADPGRALDDRSLELALAELDDALAELAGRISPNTELDRTERRRMQTDLGRYLRYVAAAPTRQVPVAMELRFGMPEAELPAVALGAGDLELRGSIDRVDVDPVDGTAIIYDYKATFAPPQAKWIEEGRLQPALYMRVAETLLGVSAVGGLYQPLRPQALRPRGALREDIEHPLVGKADRLPATELAALVDRQIAVATAAADELARGRLEPRPQSCTSKGVCRYPTICRCERQ
jgi:ATP-dependent helicase/DNAse subunit B